MPDSGYQCELFDVPVEKMNPGPNVREDPREAELPALGESLKVGQHVPVILDPQYFIIDGWRRWLAARLVGVKTLKAIITKRPLSDGELKIAQVTMSVHRSGISGWELYKACYELLQTFPSWSKQELAECLNFDPSSMTRILSPSGIIPAAREALKAGKIGLSDSYVLCKEKDESKQAILLGKKLNDGASRDELERLRRTPKSRRNSSSVKSTRISILLPDGVMVVISGPGLTTDGVQSACSDIQKEAKKAVDKNQNVKTFEAIMRDRQKGAA